mgnify:CR=1 FL=1
MVRGTVWEIDLRRYVARMLLDGSWDAVAATPEGFAASGRGKVAFHRHDGAKAPRPVAQVAFPPGEFLTVFAEGSVVAYLRKDDESIMLVAVAGEKTWYLGTVDPSKQLGSAVHREHERAFVESRASSHELLDLDVAGREARAAHPDGDGVALTKPPPRRIVR